MDERPGGFFAGGSVGRDEIDAAAMIGLAGMDPVRFLEERDPVAAWTMGQVARRRLELGAELREDLAVRIANNVGVMLGG